jgi:hypothetical protein
MCSWFLEKTEAHPKFLKGVLFSDEANFYVNGEVNKQNCCYLSQEHPTDMHPVRNKVWSSDSLVQYMGLSHAKINLLG